MKVQLSKQCNKCSGIITIEDKEELDRRYDKVSNRDNSFVRCIVCGSETLILSEIRIKHG